MTMIELNKKTDKLAFSKKCQDEIIHFIT